MSKSFFRFLRGELNGFYITSFYNAFNKSTELLKAFLMDFKNQQFKYDMISDDNLFGLGKFAGIFLPRISQAESLTALRMSESKVVDDEEFSERGLFYIPLEYFKYYHLNFDATGRFYFMNTTQEEYEEDINTLALEERRSSLVGNEPVIGYLTEDSDDIFNSDGTVKESKLLATPPQGKAYTRFYGDQFSYLSEGTEDDIDKVVRMTLTESYEVDGEEYSERGLYKPPLPDYEDINSLATVEERSSLVGDEEVLGYISENETDVLDEYGNVRPDKVLATPPIEGAYSEYYGDKFLFLAEGDVKYEAVTPSLFLDLFKSLQKIRYNGTSIKTLVEIIDTLCPDGMITLDSTEVSLDGKYIYVYYVYDSEVTTVTYKGQRKALLEYLVEEKFKQVVLVENL